MPDQRRWAFEVKRSLSPRPERGFHSAREDLKPQRQFIVYPGSDRFPSSANTDALGLLEACRELEEAV